MQISEGDLTLFSPPKTRHFVYLLLDRKEVVYVGLTSHPGPRTSNHRGRGRQFDTTLVREYRSLAAAKRAEQAYLAKYLPKYNVIGTGKPYQQRPSYQQDCNGLTPRRRQVLCFIVEFHQENRRLPTLKDIGTALQLRNYHAVGTQVDYLRRRGLLHESRIEPTEEGLALIRG